MVVLTVVLTVSMTNGLVTIVICVTRRVTLVIRDTYWSVVLRYQQIFLVVILQSILHVCGESALSRNLDIVFVKLFVADGPTSCL